MFKNYPNNPILEPVSESDWQNLKVYNPAVIKHGDSYLMFYRAVGTDGISRIGQAESSDGLVWHSRSEPVFVPDSGLESAGVEDPRLVKIEDNYYLTYTAYDGQTARQALARSSDLQTWQRYGPILPHWDWTTNGGFLVGADPARFNPAPDWSKVGSMFCELVNGKYQLLFGDSCIWLASSDDAVTWTVREKPFLKPRPGFFDNYYLEMGPPPIKLPDGWLVFYHGVNHQMVYALGALRLDTELKIIARSDEALLVARAQDAGSLVDINPETAEETAWPRVIFASTALLEKNHINLYYGIADNNIGLATADLTDILSSLKNVL